MKAVTNCPNCGGVLLRWSVHSIGPSDVTDGRIRMSEVHVGAYRYCEECSETLERIDEDEINAMLNRRTS